MNYLELVNNTILEAGVRVDPLDASDFDDPDDPIHRKIKGLVADAWDELRLERGEWEFVTKEGLVIIGPSFTFSSGDGAGILPGDTITGDETQATMEVTSVTILSGEWGLGTASGIVAVKNVAGAPKFNEKFTQLLSGDNIRITGFGRINLKGFLSDFSELASKADVFIQETGGSVNQVNSGNQGIRNLTYVTWSTWNDSFESTGVLGEPTVITTTPTGLFDLWPRPDKEYLLKFTYTADQDSLTVADDTPDRLDRNYHKAIVWRAVMDFADGDGQRNLFFKAKRKWDWYEQRMGRNLMPTLSFGPNRFDYGDTH